MPQTSSSDTNNSGAERLAPPLSIINFLIVWYCVADDLDGEGEAKVEVGEGKKPISASSGRTKVESPHTNTNSPMPPPPPGSAPPRVLSHPVVPSPSTISDVAQLEVLVRVSVMMSQLHGAGSQPHWDLTLAALAYCSLIWKVCLDFLNCNLTSYVVFFFLVCVQFLCQI